MQVAHIGQEGSVSALATIKEMERIKSWKIIESTGKYFRKKLLQISLKNRIKIKLNDSISIIGSMYWKVPTYNL